MSFCVAGVALCDIPTCFIPCRKCQNWREARTKCSFCCAHVSHLESLVFLWPRRVYGGSCKTFPFRRFSTVKIGGSLARNACFAAPTCLVSSLWFSCGLAVSMGEARRASLGGSDTACWTERKPWK